MSIKITSPSNPEITFIINLAEAIDEYELKHDKLIDAATLKMLLPAYTKAFKNRRRVKDVQLDEEVTDLIISNWEGAEAHLDIVNIVHNVMGDTQRRQMTAVEKLKLQTGQNCTNPVPAKAKGFGSK